MGGRKRRGEREGERRVREGCSKVLLYALCLTYPLILRLLPSQNADDQGVNKHAIFDD